jgi:hypothetical protein
MTQQHVSTYMPLDSSRLLRIFPKEAHSIDSGPDTHFGDMFQKCVSTVV